MGAGPNNADGSVGVDFFGGSVMGVAVGAGIGAVDGSGFFSSLGSEALALSPPLFPFNLSGISNVFISSTVSGDSNCFSLSSSTGPSLGI